MTNLLYILLFIQKVIIQVINDTIYPLKLHCKKHISVCPQEDLYGDTGTITSPGYPNIARQPHYCMWMIRVKKDRRITFKIEDADIASVTKFSLYDDGRFDSATIAEKTDIQTGATYETSSNKAKIIFWQESVREVGKFKITYTSDKPTCKNTFHKCYKVFQTD